MCVLSCVQQFEIPQTVARQAPLSMGSSRQEDWSGLPFPSPRDLPDQGLIPSLLHCRRVFTVWASTEAQWWWFQSTLYVCVCVCVCVFRPRQAACKIILPWRRNEPRPSTVKARSPSHCCEEIPSCFSYMHLNYSLNLAGLTDPSAFVCLPENGWGSEHHI